MALLVGRLGGEVEDHCMCWLYMSDVTRVPKILQVGCCSRSRSRGLRGRLGPREGSDLVGSMWMQPYFNN